MQRTVQSYKHIYSISKKERFFSVNWGTLEKHQEMKKRINLICQKRQLQLLFSCMIEGKTFGFCGACLAVMFSLDKSRAHKIQSQVRHSTQLKPLDSHLTLVIVL